MRVPFVSLVALLLAMLDLPNRADFITGRVVDANGVGVAGVDIDVKNLGSGGTPDITNDGTDAGGFFTTTLPAGVYQVFFKPPPPPATSLLTTMVDNVVVAGTKNMGVITLQPGVVVSARVIDSAGVPIAQLPVDVTDLATGELLVMNNDSTNAFGNFAVAVPTRAIDLDLDPIHIIGRTLAPRRFSLTPTANTNLGDITLVNGFVLSGTFRNSVGAAVSGVDLDVFEGASGARVFTPHDNSNSLGAFSMVLAPGTYDLEACPTFASRLVAVGVNGLVLQANLDTGVTTLASGVVLSGTVRDVNGTPLAGIDVDVRRTDSGAAVVTCNDNTSAQGTYAVVVPIATLNVGFALPGQHGTSGEDLHAGLTVASNLVLDGVLPRPTAEFTGAPTAGLFPLQVSFQDLSTGAVTGWSWDLGDSSAPSTLPSPTHTYTAPGSYTVRLTVSGPGGPDTRTRVGYVVVSEPAPVAEFAGAPESGVAPLAVGFTNQSSGTITTHSWTFGDGGTSTLASPTHAFTSPGTYSVTLTETGPGGTSALTRTDYITVFQPVAAEFASSPPRGFATLRVAFEDHSTGSISSWTWNFGDGRTSSERDPVHSYRQAGLYTVTLTASGPGGIDMEEKSAYVRVHGPLRSR